ncbi:respiratory chain complex I subunit 1 family protein [Anaerosacchariphilus polymeriproducens]|uniref:NADH-quinone oxidoreductase subunit H n=1 Tax=Anaerosacchariphilus polymeriproducens TaxID=1812858 RepID=A0A371ATS2_9FIRM|nr:complex I subunit 1 family protein [Anaerosacchariphilus polymeriproducens]RDU22961.1 NADH-quinone oxidoreductase subunit H [Anaerosacchariphilus polymeriproducens]
MLEVILRGLVFIIAAPFVGGLLSGIDRKITARMQGRRGPSIFQSFYDVRKLLSKQVLIVNSLQHMLVWGFLIFVVFTGVLFFAGEDILLVIFSLTTAVMFMVMASYSVNSPFSAMGSQRELIQMMSYEPMLLISAVGFYMATGTFNIKGIMQANIPAIVYLPGVFAGFLYILTVKLGKSPFDLSNSHHAHQEMVKGITTEMSGSVFALIEIAHWYENVFLLGIVGLFIVSNQWWSWIIAGIVILITFFLEILIDNTSARVKWDVMLKTVWAITLVVGGINIFILDIIR